LPAYSEYFNGHCGATKHICGPLRNKNATHQSPRICLAAVLLLKGPYGTHRRLFGYFA
jgi:hypothetical protein